MDPNNQQNNTTTISSKFPMPKKTTSAVSPEESKFLQDQIAVLKTGDDMDIMTCLITLCDHLSLSSDQIADDPNMPLLLEEVCKNLEKTYITELIIYTLQCVNNILDLNPAFTMTLKKIGAIPKIVILMSVIDDMTCLESIIKIIEKISYENSFILLENNTFTSLLNVIDFLGENQRKSVMNACLNMVINASSYHSLSSYIKPSLMTLASLTQYNENDIKTTNKAILIFYYVVYHIKSNSYIKTYPDLEAELLQYCFIENLSEIIQRYLMNPNDKKIGSDLVKTILKIFTSLCSVSSAAFDKIIEVKFLNAIVDMIQSEFNIGSNEDNFEKNPVSFLSELFPLLTSFFPSHNAAKKEDKILNPKNIESYNFFCNSIISPLIKNIMLKSACSTLNNAMKLLIKFATNASKETIVSCMDAKALSQIISKLLDTKYLPYLVDNISMLTILMEKAPERFIVPFIREGIVENIRNFKFTYKTESELKNEIRNEDSGDISEGNEYIMEDEMEIENDEGGNIKETISPVKEDEKPKEPTIETKNSITVTTEEKNTNTEETKKDSLQNKFKEIEKEFLTVTEKINESNECLNNGLKIVKKLKGMGSNFEHFIPYSTNAEIKTLEGKLNTFIAQYFTDEKIKSLLEKCEKNNNSNLKTTLTTLKNTLSKTIDTKSKEEITSILNDIITILSEPKNELTLFELEGSQILIALCVFFEKNFVELNNLIKDDDTLKGSKMHLSSLAPYIQYNKDIFSKVKLFIDCFANSKEKMTNFIKMLQYTITSMNCFTMIIDDASTNNLNLIFNEAIKDTKRFEMRIVYNEALYNEKILNEVSLNEKFKEKLSEYNNSFKQSKEMKIIISQKSSFKDISSLLLSNTGISFTSDAKYDVVIDFSIDIKLKDKTETINIDGNWKYKELEKEIVSKYTNNHLSYSLYNNTVIKFGLNYKLKDELNKENVDTKDAKKKKTIQDYLPLSAMNIDNNDYYQIEKKIFEHFYHYNIIFNKNLYEIKRLMPSLYLLSLLYFPLTKFPSLFEIKNLFSEEEIEKLFLNPKVTLLISRASRDGYSISKGSIPSWCYNLSMDFNFLSKFQTRHLLFKVSFDPKRSLINLQNYLKAFDPSFSTEHQITITKGMRLKAIVERDHVVEYANKFLNDPVTSKFIGYLEFEYLNEIGNGIGPTLEFYSLVINSIKSDSSLWYKTTDASLYPAILNKKKDNVDIINKFKLIGFIVARALYDDRLIDIPLSKVFWDVVLGRAVPLSEIAVIDKDLGKTINDFNEIINKKKKFISEYSGQPENLNSEIEKNILYNNTSIDSLDIYFTLPGYDEIELKPNGANIQLTIHNIDEYVSLVYNALFLGGVIDVIDAFRKGFTCIFSLSNMKIFKSSEIEESICGSLETKWDKDNLFDNLKPEHGIGKESRIFKDLISFMCSLNKTEQRKFLTFVTGTSRLPIGGFKSLSPKLTVVKRTCNPGENPDDFLPTVMTCQNYLKLPEYSSYEVLKEKITLAMNEGNNEFHLS